MIAIIRRAILDFAVYRHADPSERPAEYALAEDAAGWLFWDGTETVDDEGKYTFLYICQLLELDARAIRQCALKLQRDEVQRLSSSGEG